MGSGKADFPKQKDSGGSAWQAPLCTRNKSHPCCATILTGNFFTGRCLLADFGILDWDRRFSMAAGDRPIPKRR